MKKYLTWEELADFYKEKTGRTAQIQPMENIYNLAIKQEEIAEDKNGIYKKEKK